MRKPARYRYVTPTKKGRWRDSMKEARLAAARAGLGTIEVHSGTIYLDVLVKIETEGV